MTRGFEIALLTFNSCFQIVTRVLPHHFLPGFFHGNRNSTESMFFFATIVKLNGQNNCIRSFPFSRYKEKQVCLLVALPRDSIFGSQKNHMTCKTLFPVVF